MRFCSASHHECCKEWSVPGLVVSIVICLSIFFPTTFGLIIAALTTPVGIGVMITLIGGIAVRKSQVRAWEIDRPFNDGLDETPDMYLFNPGPGATFGLRAFMPDVRAYSFWRQPISWAIKQAKRKVAILLDDGTVSFPWFPVAWISDASEGGSRIQVPEGYKISAKQGGILQAKRDAIKNISPSDRTEYQHDFMLFTDMIFGMDTRIGVEQDVDSVEKIAYLEERVNNLAGILQNNIGKILRDNANIFDKFEQILSVKKDAVEAVAIDGNDNLPENVRDLARSVDRLSAMMQHHRKAVMNLSAEKPRKKK